MPYMICREITIYERFYVVKFKTRQDSVKLEFLGLALGAYFLGPVTAMETNQTEIEIKETLEFRVEMCLKSPQNIRTTNNGNGLRIAIGDMGSVIFPLKELLKCDNGRPTVDKNKISNFIKNSHVPRPKMTLQEYLNNDSLMPKSIIVGSGLAQATIQPITINEYKNSFYIDTTLNCHPDMVASFGTCFVYHDDVYPHTGKFDHIYFDNFWNMCESEVLEAAYKMLKTDGRLTITYRSMDIKLDEDINVYLNSLNVDEQPKERRSIEIPAIMKTLEKNGFGRIHRSNSESAIRQNGFSFYHIYGYKKSI